MYCFLGMPPSEFLSRGGGQSWWDGEDLGSILEASYFFPQNLLFKIMFDVSVSKLRKRMEEYYPEHGYWTKTNST